MTVELAEEMRRIGWECDLLCPSDLRSYLTSHAADYDVVDYDHACLPYPRGGFSRKSLFVARSVLLAHHLETIAIPQPQSVKVRIGGLVRQRARHQRDMICKAQITVEQANLVNVSNGDDKAELIRRGIAGDKIVVLPYGISRDRRVLFDLVPSEAPAHPIIAFVGTFDYRKGANEFPALVESIVRSVPNAQFRLLGTAGLFQTAAEVLAHFPVALRQKIEIIPKFHSDDLPALLASCSVGVFPSYMEGMPFGVLEMLAASVPVIAYDAPGLPMLLPTNYLVPRGSVQTMVQRVTTLLWDHSKLSEARRWAKQRSQQFSWVTIAQETDAIYRERLLRL
ncbi:MAG: glycosyltransferase family 4 protein [Janthinobacterium lividum]